VETLLVRRVPLPADKVAATDDLLAVPEFVGLGRTAVRNIGPTSAWPSA
jgi:hypothetical protein